MILRKEILINPLDRSALQDPVIERTWTWERWMHEEYRKHFQESPLNGKPMNGETPAHLFAQDLSEFFQVIK
ncbi:MAG: hypothetical protein WCP39_02040 [Chlamydiota bacterium]